MQVTPREDRREVERCPLCHAPASADALTTCATCATSAHAGCLRDLGRGRCPTQGCAPPLARAVAGKMGPRASRRLGVILATALLAFSASCAANEWRAARAFDSVAQRFARGEDLDDARPLLAELRAMPRGLFTDSQRLDAMTEALEEVVRREERRRAEER